MSYTTFTSTSRTTRGRGGGVRGRGRGRGEGNPQTRTQNQMPAMAHNSSQNPRVGPAPMSGQTTGPESGGAVGGASPNDRVQRKDAYTVFAPDEKKRNKILQGAQKEEDQYRKYKESQRPSHVSYVGTVGGGLTHPESTQQRTIQQKAMSPAKRAQLHRTKQRQEEEQTYTQKKLDARKKAETATQREAERKSKLDEDRRRKNEEFLKRFEKGN